MKIIIMCSMAILFGCTIAHSQNTTPHTAEGDRALLFSINGFGTFGVQGNVAASLGSTTASRDSSPGFGSATSVYGIGAKYFIAPNTALRVSLGFGTSSTSLPGANGSSSSSLTSVVGLSPGIEYHLLQTGSVTGYAGGFTSIAHASSGSGGEETDYSSSVTSISLGGMLGVEFFPWREISLGAEYQLGMRFSSSSTTAQGSSTDGPSATDIGISTVAVRLGVYF